MNMNMNMIMIMNTLVFTDRDIKADQFIRDVFDNKHDHFDLLWQRLDLIKPEPAWKRKRQPVQVIRLI